MIRLRRVGKRGQASRGAAESAPASSPLPLHGVAGADGGTATPIGSPRRWMWQCSCGVNAHMKNAAVVYDGERCDHCPTWDKDDGRVTTELGWCGCGTPEVVDGLMVTYLRSADDDGICRARGDIGLLLAYIADDLGWTEHGGSVFGAWLTDDGREALANLGAGVR